MQADIIRFESIFKAHYEGLCRSALRIVQDKAAAEDLVQDVFLQVWQKQFSLDNEQHMLSYLHKSVIHQALNYLRSQKNRSFREEHFGTAVYQESNFTEGGLQLKELQKKVNEVINALPPACRTVFILSRFEHMSYKEIAKNLDISVKTVENQMVKALKHLRQHLSPFILLFLEFFF